MWVLVSFIASTVHWLHLSWTNFYWRNHIVQRRVASLFYDYWHPWLSFFHKKSPLIFWEIKNKINSAGVLLARYAIPQQQNTFQALNVLIHVVSLKRIKCFPCKSKLATYAYVLYAYVLPYFPRLYISNYTEKNVNNIYIYKYYNI